MYYIVRVWEDSKLQYEQEFPPELPNNEIKARNNLKNMEKLWPECDVVIFTQPTSIYNQLNWCT